MKTVIKNTIALIFILFVFACSKPEEKIPSDILPKDKMVAVLVDIHFAEAAASINRQTDTSAITITGYYDYIYKIHNTNAEEVKKSFNFYQDHPALFKNIYEEVINEISRKQGESVND